MTGALEIVRAGLARLSAGAARLVSPAVHDWSVVPADDGLAWGPIFQPDECLPYMIVSVFSSVMWFPSIAVPTVAPTAAPAIRVAFFGGSHLYGMVQEQVVPAIRRLAASRPLTLMTLGVVDQMAPSAGLTVDQQPYQVSHLAGVEALGRAGVTVLAHPGAPGLPSSLFNNPHALITANAIGAAAVISDAPPYSDLRSESVARLCNDTVDGWNDGLARATDAAEAPSIAMRLACYCTRESGGTVNAAVRDVLLALHARLGALTAGRAAIIAASLGTGRLQRGLRRLLPSSAAEAVS